MQCSISFEFSMSCTLHCWWNKGLSWSKNKHKQIAIFEPYLLMHVEGEPDLWTLKLDLQQSSSRSTENHKLIFLMHQSQICRKPCVCFFMQNKPLSCSCTNPKHLLHAKKVQICMTDCVLIQGFKQSLSHSVSASLMFKHWQSYVSPHFFLDNLPNAQISGMFSKCYEKYPKYYDVLWLFLWCPAQETETNDNLPTAVWILWGEFVQLQIKNYTYSTRLWLSYFRCDN